MTRLRTCGLARRWRLKCPNNRYSVAPLLKTLLASKKVPHIIVVFYFRTIHYFFCIDNFERFGYNVLGMDKISFNATESVTVEFYVANDDTLQDKKIFLPHLHDKTEIYILLDGDSSFVVGDETISLSPYDALVIPPYTLHHCILPKPTKHNHACFWINGSFDAFNEVLQNRDFLTFSKKNS